MPPSVNIAPPSSNEIRLIVNADDFGICESVNRGIVQAHREGIVTSTSLMAVGLAFDQAVKLCREIPSLDVGVHLTLVAEKPLLANVGSLMRDDGRFPADVGSLAIRLLAGKVRLADVHREWSAQIERILDHGIRLTHMDSHQHVHALPGLSRVALTVAQRYRIPFVRLPMEVWPFRRLETIRSLSRRAGAIVLAASCTLSRLSRWGRKEVRPPKFLGFQEGGCLTAARLSWLLNKLQPRQTYELMCHPGYPPTEPEVKRWDYAHHEELLALTDPAIRQVIAARKIRLIGFADLTR